MSSNAREDFEHWVKSRWPKACLDLCTKEAGSVISVGQYLDVNIESKWQAFEASRAALVVDLNDQIDPPKLEDYDNRANSARYKADMAVFLAMTQVLKYCREALTKAGVTVK